MPARPRAIRPRCRRSPRSPPAGDWASPTRSSSCRRSTWRTQGADRFPSIFVELGNTETKFVRAVELHIGDRRVLHHMVLFQGPFAMTQDIVDTRSPGNRKSPLADMPKLLYVWAAGSPPIEFPEGMGHVLNANQVLTLNMHYHPSGKAGTDTSKLGLYYADKAPVKEYQTAVAIKPSLRIPANSNDTTDTAYFLFHRTARCSRTCRTCTSAARPSSTPSATPTGGRGGARRAAVQLRLAVDLSARRAQGRSRRHAAPGRRAVGQLRRQPAQSEPQRRSRVRRRNRRRDAGRLRRLRGEGRRAPGAGADRERAAPPDGAAPSLDGELSRHLPA